MNIFVKEQLAALYEGIQNAEVNFFIRPFALAEKGGVFIPLGKDTNFRLMFFLGIVALTASKRGKLYRALAGK